MRRPRLPLPALPLALTAVLPIQAQAPGSPEVTQCLDRARPALHTHLTKTHGDVLALCCLAALHDGTPHHTPLLLRALDRLSRSALPGTYGAALRLMVLAEHPTAFGTDLEARDQLLARDVKTLLRNRAAGGFTYPKRNGYWDLSNTQYAALGLRAAASLGHPVPTEVWLRLCEVVAAAQTETGGFGYTVGHRRKHAYASMTVAGIAVLQIGAQMLPKDEVVRLRLAPVLQRAWKWMADNKLDIGDDRTPSCLYFHYGLERAAILSDRNDVGGRDWYRVGATMLMRMQDAKSGAWRSSWEIRPGALAGPGSPVDTAFAVLFLRRGFRKLLPARYPRLSALGAQARDDEIAAAARAAIRRGIEFVPEVLKALRSPLAPTRSAARIALHALAGQDFGYDPRPDPARSSPAIHAAERWWLSRSRKR
ncbi:MAG: hypothetical protein H6837_05780 [Planctomycetes bacterium]|nr:hypothetical protein [Planctomycetota bacterium]